MPKGYRFYRRKFLNRPGVHELGAVLALIERTTGRYQLARVSITDCSRKIELDFDADTATEKRNALEKARLLRDTFIDFTDALEDLYGGDE